MALKDIKESVRAFRAANLRHKIVSMQTRPQADGSIRMFITWRCPPFRGRPHVIVEDHGTYTLDEKGSLYEWFRGLV